MLRYGQWLNFPDYPDYLCCQITAGFIVENKLYRICASEVDWSFKMMDGQSCLKLAQ